MRSPFPGMDPYLESPGVFPCLHSNMITYLQEVLQPKLPQVYYASTGERVWIEVTQQYIEPAPGLVTVPHDERMEAFLEVYARKDGGDRLVTSIEILSWINKTPGEHGRGLYLLKQKEILDGKVNLVEIDLLRGGEHSTAVPKDRLLRKVGTFDYHVSVHPFFEFENFYIYAIQLEQALPEISIPLLPEDGAVSVDLQAVFDRCYEAGAYPRQVRYLEETPNPPLSPERMKWAKGLLKTREK